MSTSLINNKRFSLVKYFDRNKMMYQITQRYDKESNDDWCHLFGYVHLSKKDLEYILRKIKEDEK